MNRAGGGAWGICALAAAVLALPWPALGDPDAGAVIESPIEPLYPEEFPGPAAWAKKRLAATPPELGRGVARTMALLASGTARRRQPVRVLIYGQSISHGNWSKLVEKHLRARFAHAEIDYRNLAIGGFASPMLVRTVIHDVIPFYPDLVIFHDYGDQQNYEEIIRQIRTQTTAEIIIANDHISTGQDAKFHDEHSWTFLPALCQRWGLECVDVRRAWLDYLADQKLVSRAVLSDQVHLNPHGNALMAVLIERHLRAPRAPSLSAPLSEVKTLLVGRDVKWEGEVLRVPFTGNRVDLIQAAGSKSVAPRAAATVLIDGRAPSEIPALYGFSRPNAEPNRDWPWRIGAVYRVDWKTPLLIEEWTLRLTEVSPGAKVVSFDLFGTVTGSDGQGRSDQPFVSRSGRVAIDPGDWFLARASGRPSGVEFRPGFKIRWRVEFRGADTYQDPAYVDPARDAILTVVQGLDNGPHELILRARSNGDGVAQRPSLTAIRTFRPATGPR